MLFLTWTIIAAHMLQHYLNLKSSRRVLNSLRRSSTDANEKAARRIEPGRFAGRCLGGAPHGD
jgi:hypothetical protein